MATVEEIITGIDRLREELAETLSSNPGNPGLASAQLDRWATRAHEQLSGWGLPDEANRLSGASYRHAMNDEYGNIRRKAEARDVILQVLREDMSKHPDFYRVKLGQQPSAQATAAAAILTPQERVRLSFLVFDLLPKPQPDGMGGQTGGEELYELLELLQRALGRRNIGRGGGIVERIASFIETAPEEELLTMIELLPAAQARGDRAKRSPFPQGTNGKVATIREAANQFLERINCAASFGPDGTFFRDGFADRTLPELANLPDKEKLLGDIGGQFARGIPVAVLFVDLDGFKSVNDQLGHEAGDKCLVSVVQIIGSAILEKGRLYRWGGDEFVVVLPNFCLAEAAATAERIRSRIDESNPGGAVKVTTSIGVADSSGSTEAQKLLTSADEAMYVCKYTGKNRLTTAPPPPDLKAQADANRRKETCQ